MGKKADAAPPDVPLTKVFPRWVVVVLGVVCFAIFSVVLLRGIFAPWTLYAFENEAPRFVLVVALAVYVAVFLFILYPQKVVWKPVGLDFAARVVGPAALVLILLGVLMKIAPDPSSDVGWLYGPRDPEGKAVRIRAAIVRLLPVGEQFTYRLVPDHEGFLAGVYVQFKPGQHKLHAEFQADLHEDTQVTFDRAERYFVLDIKPVGG